MPHMLLAALAGAIAGYAFRGSIRNDIAKVVAAAKADAAKVEGELAKKL